MFALAGGGGGIQNFEILHKFLNSDKAAFFDPLGIKKRMSIKSGYKKRYGKFSANYEYHITYAFWLTLFEDIVINNIFLNICY